MQITSSLFLFSPLCKDSSHTLSKRMLGASLGFERRLHVIENDPVLGKLASYPFLCILLIDLV